MTGVVRLYRAESEQPRRNQRLAGGAGADDSDDFVYREPTTHPLGKTGPVESSQGSN